MSFDYNVIFIEYEMELGANAVILETLNFSILCPTIDVITDI